MVFLLPILAPILLPVAIGTNIMELLTDNAALNGSSWWDQMLSFWSLVWHTMTTWL
jgi:hypothetical protein